MCKSRDDLDSKRLAIMSGLVDEIAAERGLDPKKGLSPSQRYDLTYHAEVAYEAWSERMEDGETLTPSTPIEYLLAELYALDAELREAMGGGGRPGDPIQ
jgi:hypothetical protein